MNSPSSEQKWTALTDAIEPQARIMEAIRNLENDYAEAVKAVKRMKDEINQLEKAVVEEGHVEKHIQMEKLNSAMDRLDAFVDSWILKSRDVWNTYRALETASLTVKEADFSELNALKNLCERSEQLAKDLLCYSLGHPKQTKS